MAVQHSVPNTAISARGFTHPNRNDGPVFGILDTRALSDLPSGIAYASLPYRHDAIGLADFARLDLPLPHALASAAPKRRIEHLAGRICARAAIHQLTGTSATIGMAASGGPVWPPGLTGSISHSKGRAVAVAARRTDWRTLGLDIEVQFTTEMAGELVPLILTPDERRRFAGRIDPHFLTLGFSLKEALYKALHPLVDCFFDHHAAEILEYDPRGRATLQIMQDLSQDWPQGSRVRGRFWCHTGFCVTLVWIDALENNTMT